MSLGTILLIVLALVLLGGGGWGHLNGAPWAGTYGNGGLGLGFILLIVVLFLLFRG